MNAKQKIKLETAHRFARMADQGLDALLEDESINDVERESLEAAQGDLLDALMRLGYLL